MSQDPKRLDSLIVDVEDSTTLLKLYIGRLMKAPARAMFYPPLFEHASEISVAVAGLEDVTPGREFLVRIATVLTSVAAEINATQSATSERVLVLQEAIDLLEAQLDHMIRLDDGPAREVASDLARLEALVHQAPADADPVAPSPSVRTDAALGEIFEEDPFDEFAMSDDFLDELVSGFDAALDASIAEASRAEHPPPDLAPSPAFVTDEIEPGHVELSPAEEQALKDLFAQIASSYVGPITDFVGKLRVGPVSTTWVDLCHPAITSMSRASESMGYANVQNALDAFGNLLVEVRQASRVVDGDSRVRVLTAYQHLAELLPATFPDVAPDPNAESESIILNSLLKQIKGVGRVTIARLFSAGLVSLGSYDMADPGDLAAAAGLKPALAARICELFRQYREVSELSSDSDLVMRRLEVLVSDLRAAQFEYKKATLEEWYTHQPSRSKARARRTRQQTMWKVNVALAELGEVRLLNALKDEIYDKRIERLKNLIECRAAGASGGAAS